MMIVGVLLAAGQSVRFGSDKRLIVLGEEHPMVLGSAMNLKPHVDELFVVVGEGDEPVGRLLASSEFTCLTVSRHQEGMGSSLADAMIQLKARFGETLTGVMVALGDMPFIHPNTYGLVKTALLSGARMVRPIHAERPGHPVGFSGEAMHRLLDLSGELSPKHMFKPEDWNFLEVEDSGCLMDIDTPEDVRSWTPPLIQIRELPQ